MSAKMIKRKYLSSFLSTCGLFAVLDRRRMTDNAFVLMYHRVLASNDLHKLYIQPGMYVTSSSFEKQICFLKSKYRILLLEELINKIRRKETVGGCCAITFDDGWLDNHTNAFPVLKKYQAPATIFLATDFIGTNRLFWPEEICCYLERSSLVRHASPSSLSTVLWFLREIEKYSSANRDLFLDKAIEVLKGLSPDERNTILEYFRGMGKSQDLPRQMLNWEEVDEMSNSGLLAFGAHTAGHEILDQLPISKARIEISKSKEEIEQRLGVKVSIFAYPNGNYNENVQKVLQECTFAGAVTTRKGLMNQETSLMEIPRIGIHEDISYTVPMFQGRILLEKF